MEVKITDTLKERVWTYAAMVNAEVDYPRLQAHERLVRTLEDITGKDWSDFNPFEDELIKSVPSALKCRQILWKAIRDFKPIY